MLASKIATFVAPTVHLLIAIVECVVFPGSKDSQKQLLGKDCETKEVLDTVTLVLFNLGAYSAIVASATLYGIFFKYDNIVLVTLVMYVINGLVFSMRFPSRWFRGLIQVTPSIIALGTPNELDEHNPQSSHMPIPIITFCAILHILFFIAEALLFSKKKSVQKIFMGKAAHSSAAVEAATGFMVCQGFYNLCLALGTMYGVFVIHDEAVVRCFLLCFVAASLALMVSQPKLYKGALLQGGPAIVALYVMRRT
jgi:uncharacterized membrane protein